MTTSQHPGAVPPRRSAAVYGLRRTAAQAARVFRPSDGTGVLQLSPDEVDPTTARKVLDLAMRVAEMMLSHGASANDVTVNALRITRAYDLRSVHVDVTYTSIYVSYYRGHDREPLTTFRVVRARSIDYTRLQRLQGLVSRIGEGLPVDEAFDLFAAIVRAPHPYRRWVVTVANAGVAASVCVLLNASPLIILIAFLASAAIDLLMGWLAKKQVPTFFVQALGASIPTLAAIGLMKLAYDQVSWLGDIRPELIVAGGVVLMLSGLSAVGAAQDAIDGYYVTAGARTYEVLVLTLGIVVGILASLQLGDRLGVPVVLSGAAPPVGNLAQQIGGSLLISMFFAASTYAGPRTVVLCGGMGVLGWLGYLGGTLVGLGTVSASALGAFVPALLSVPMARRLQVPSLALITAALVPLMPGSMVYRGILEIVAHTGSKTSFGDGAMTLFNAAGVGMALAAGASLGTYLARPGRANLRHAGPRGGASAAETSISPDSPDAQRTTARAEEATTGTLPVVRHPHDQHG
ncbi:threonine/serine ThrE exporter family protein [Arsenicicoccus sp. oral taxon 190]|uniref:threonine/serine ThrE exporter family protein n=1 Tax=Arsenicicoccus sp. oral taxon 190 TaxID=1658671 RepID=UPI000A4625D2|nr:threonine/serine exporter family protein [Arsenicicoccus sp. oral taxon 190]